LNGKTAQPTSSDREIESRVDTHGGLVGTFPHAGRLGAGDPALKALGNAAEIYDQLGRISDAGGEMLKCFNNIAGKSEP